MIPAWPFTFVRTSAMQAICPGRLGLAQAWRSPAGSAGERGVVMNRGAAGFGQGVAVRAALRVAVVWAEPGADADWEEADAAPGADALNPNSARAATATSETGPRRDEGMRKGLQIRSGAPHAWD
jgi:hypothetical protein